MASITIHAAIGKSVNSAALTGNEQLLVTTKDGKPSTLTVN